VGPEGSAAGAASATGAGAAAAERAAPRRTKMVAKFIVV